MGKLVMQNRETGSHSKRQDRRAWVRHNIYVPLELRGKDMEGRLVSEFTFSVNISTGGAFILSLNEFKPCAELEILIPALSQQIAGKLVHARVVRIDRDIKGFSGVCKYGVGVEFPERIDRIEELREAYK